MDTVVVVTRLAPKDSEVVQQLREAGWRVVVRRFGPDLDEIALDMPDLAVVEVPADRAPRATLEPILAAPGMEGRPVLAVVAQSGTREAASIGRLIDFAVTPLRPGELEARARRPLAAKGRDEEDRIRVGGLVIDLKGYEVSVAGAPIDLTYQEFKLLTFLASHPGHAFSRDQLLARVWGYDYYGGSRTVDIHVRRIRAKLDAPYAGCLQTIRNVGYKWVPLDETTPDGGGLAGAAEPSPDEEENA